MIKPLSLDGMQYHKEDIEHLREDVIFMRNQRLVDSSFADAVCLSHVIALLSHLAEHTETQHDIKN